MAKIKLLPKRTPGSSPEALRAASGRPSSADYAEAPTLSDHIPTARTSGSAIEAPGEGYVMLDDDDAPSHRR